jgi:hypothetical protein
MTTTDLIFQLIAIVDGIVQSLEGFLYDQGGLEYLASSHRARFRRSLCSLQESLKSLKNLQGRCQLYSDSVCDHVRRYWSGY